MQFNWPTPYQLMLGTSLAIVSFVGLESISQAAQETQRPASIIPRTSVALILTILIFALAYSNLALGLHPWHPIVDANGHPMQFWQIFPHNADNQGKAVALLAAQVPYYGAFAALYVPVLGAVLLLDIVELRRLRKLAHRLRDEQQQPAAVALSDACTRGSARPQCRSSSSRRIAVIELIFAAATGTLSLRRFALRPLLPRRKRARVPRRSLCVRRGDELLVRLSRLDRACALRDPLSPRKFKIPLNVPFRFRGERVEFPVIAVIGFIGIFSILMFTLRTHALGRIFGPSWLVLGFVLYLIYRRYRRLPLLRSQKRDWRSTQMDILRRSGELELMDEYLANLKASDERRGGAPIVTCCSCAPRSPSR